MPIDPSELPEVRAVDVGPDSTCPPPEEGVRPPALRLPVGAVDSHCHLFGPTDVYPYPQDASFRPPEAGLDRLRALHDVLGLQRAVLVHSMAHGTDLSPVLDALAAEPGRYRGVGVLGQATTDSEIAGWAEAGVCGLRLNFLPHLGGAPAPEVLDRVLGVVRRHGWHLEVHVAGSGISDYADLVAGFDVPVVIDHMARLSLGTSEGDDGLGALLRLLDLGHVWVKVSGVDRMTREPPPFADAVSVARRLVEHAPERTVWGTDFPHPNVRGWLPSNTSLVELLGVIAPSSAARQRLLVTNPTRLFGFGTDAT